MPLSCESCRHSSSAAITSSRMTTPGYKRRAGKMSGQTRMISVDRTENLKRHAQGFVSASISDERATLLVLLHTASTRAKPNRWQYVANALSTSSALAPNCDRSYRWLADCLFAWLATSTRMLALLPATVTSRKIRRSAELREWVRDKSRHIECRRCGCLARRSRSRKNLSIVSDQ